MNDITASTHATLPGLIEQAAAALATATTAAEVLDAKNKAGFAYTTAKAAARLAEAKNAHDAIVAACRKAMGDALIIQAAAQCRLADEYDAAQERGEVQKPGGDRTSSNVPKENNAQTVEDVGLTRKQVFEARAIRDAEKTQPGIVRETIEGKLKAGRGPTLADVKHAIAPAPAQPREDAPSPAKKSAATTNVRPNAKKIQRVFMTPDSDDWKEVVPRVDAEKVIANLDKLLGKYDDLLEVYDLVATDCNELQRRLNMLVEAVKTTGLLPIKNEDGPEPKIVIADLDKTNAWLKEAKAEWSSDRMRRCAATFVNLPPESSWEEIMPHYRENNSSESETPPAARALG